MKLNWRRIIGGPLPGIDAQWLAMCSSEHCKNDMTLHASRGSFRNGSVQHCYSCGLETTISGFDPRDILSMVTSSLTHWLSFPIYPYNWHRLDEKTRWRIIGGGLKGLLQ
jgi:hypothetical protein